jgi:hypothetical protein
MPKRKSGGSDAPFPTPTLTSLDAALDLLACETFDRLSSLTAKFETAAGVKLNDGVTKQRWEQACMRYWLMKSMDDLSCAASTFKTSEGSEAEVAMTDDDHQGRLSLCTGLTLGEPSKSSHPGAIVLFGLDADEASVWRRWTPKAGDMVLVELPGTAGIWPGKVRWW